MGNKKYWLDSTVDNELMFCRYDKNNYIIHNSVLKLPKLISKFPFSAILFMATFIERSIEFGLESKWMDQYNF